MKLRLKEKLQSCNFNPCHPLIRPLILIEKLGGNFKFVRYLVWKSAGVTEDSDYSYQFWVLIRNLSMTELWYWVMNRKSRVFIQFMRYYLIIMIDLNGKWNIPIRKILEKIWHVDFLDACESPREFPREIRKSSHTSCSKLLREFSWGFFH